MTDEPSRNESITILPLVPRPRGLLRLVLLVVVPLIAGLVVLVLYLRGGRYVGTDNAYVEADKASISSQVAGTIKDVLVLENQGVTAGQVLFRLDPLPFQVAVARAEANLAQTRTTLLALKASYREKQAEIALARTRHAFALKDQGRQAELEAKKFISESALDASRLNADLTAQQITALEEDLARTAESLGGSVGNPVEGHPSYRMAVAELEQARLALAHVEVRAPVSGTVNKQPSPGQYLAAGDIMNYVYHHEVMLMAEITPPAQLPPAFDAITSAAARYRATIDDTTGSNDALTKMGLVSFLAEHQRLARTS